ncbi:pathogenesis associated protein Pep2 [Penicillium angulare]|uniref:Pathogenesis associated protein Pep2 n=1 Tax=Penicillium angulare TaxID=116970 RepID=A0A9W9FAV0_9EURO|nr:pathogenesis associated protein Pep2 [Penicillium angulare]
MPDLHTLPEGSRPSSAIRNNGPIDLAMERYKLRELAEGWPCYRDACEWENLKSIFHKDAYIYTSWTGRTHYMDFIKASQKGMDNGAFIMHRIHGLSTDIDVAATRAVTKMKATITQRFEIDGIEADAESDCRFVFFWSKDSSSGEWRANFVRHFYEKDKLIPVDPNRVPKLDTVKLSEFPVGYRYLGYCQELTMGVKVIRDLPGHRREIGTANREKHDILYRQIKAWMDGDMIKV